MIIFLAKLSIIIYTLSMQNIDTDTTETPEMVSPAGVSHYHPLTQATTAIHMVIDPKNDDGEYLYGGRTREELEALAQEILDTMEHQRIRELGDPALVYIAQARVLDAVFNRFVTLAFAPTENPDLDKVKFALMAQRQCADTLNKLNRRKRFKDNRFRPLDE